MCGTDEWICIHCVPNDSEAFEVGNVVRVTSDAVTAHMISTSGQDNGSRSVAFDSIMGVTTGGLYLERLRLYRDALPVTVRVEPEGDGHEGMLRAAQTAGLVVSLRLPDETLQGTVREVGEGWAAIARIEEESGGDDGVRIVSLEEAERVFVGGADEQRLAVTSRARQLRESIG